MKTKTPTKKFGVPTLNVTSGNVNIGLSTWFDVRKKGDRFCSFIWRLIYTLEDFSYIVLGYCVKHEKFLVSDGQVW